MSKKTRSLLITSVTLLVVFVGVFLIILNGQYKKSKQNEIVNLTQSYSDKIEALLSSLEDIPNYIAFPLGNTAYRDEDLRDILRLIVLNNEEIYGTTCALEPYKFNEDSLYYAPYYYKQNDTVYYANLGNEEYDYFSWNWYLIPKRLGLPVWTEPYFDDGGGNINLVTYSTPIYKYYDDYKVFMGVITVDMSLDWINEIVGSIKIKDGGFALLVSKLGTVISTDNKNKNWRLRESIFSLAEEHRWNKFRAIGEKIISGNRGLESFTDGDGEKYLISYMPIKKSSWSFLIAVKEDKI